jgi:hypothetical protein
LEFFSSLLLDFVEFPAFSGSTWVCNFLMGLAQCLSWWFKWRNLRTQLLDSKLRIIAHCCLCLYVCARLCV